MVLLIAFIHFFDISSLMRSRYEGNKFLVHVLGGKRH